MKIECRKLRLDVRDADLSGLRIDKANLAGASIVGGRLEGMTIEGIPVAELIALRRAGHEAEPS